MSDGCQRCIGYRREIERLRGERAANLDPDFLGQVVRMAWVEWASEQAEPKFSWLVPWDYLAEPDREADRRIGKAVAKVCVTPELLKVEAENRALRERLEKIGSACIAACQHPHPEELEAKSGRAAFYQTHIKHAWKQCEARVREALRALDADEKGRQVRCS